MKITKDGLFKIGFIESAKHKYSEIDINNNTLLLGTNNVGKTTILKALLYFYVGSPAKLGISQNKLSFKDYYLPTAESRIFYFYKKNDKYIMVLLFNKSNTIKHKFFMFNKLPNNIIDLFYKKTEEDIFEILDIEDIEDKLKNQYYCEFSPELESGDYKRVLYNDIDKKLNTSKAFSLFDDKKMKYKAYENFSKLIENIFKTDRIDSEFFLKSLLDTIENGREFTLNVNKLIENSNRFSKQHMEWELYQKAKPTIKKLVEFYNDYQQEYDLLKKHYIDLIYKTNSLPKEKNNLLDEKSILEAKLEKLNQEKTNKLTSLNTKRDKVLNQKAKIESKIETIQKLINDYQEKNINDKILKLKKIPHLENALKELKQQINILTTKAENIQIEFDKQISMLEAEKEKTKSKYKEKIAELKEKISEFKNENQEQINLKIAQIKEEYQKKFDSLNKKLNDIKLDKQKYELFKITSYEETKEAKEFKFEIDSLIKEINNLEKDTAQLNSKIEFSKEKEINLEKNKNKELNEIKNTFDKELTQLKEKEERLNKLLNPSDNDMLTLNNKLRNSDLYDTYVYFLNQDVLESNLDITFKESKENINNIFEIIPNIEIKSNKLKDKLISIQNKIQQLTIKFNENIREKEQNYKKLILKETKQRKKIIDELNEIEKRLTSLKFQLNEIKKDFQEKKTNYNIKQKNLKEENEEKLENSRKEIAKISIKLKEEKQNEIVEIEKFKKIYIEKLEKITIPLKTEIEDISKELDEINLLYKSKELKIKKEFETQLQKNGVDTIKLNQLNKEKDKIKNQIEEYKSYEKEVFLYEKDLIEINKLDEYKLIYDKSKNEENEIIIQIKEETKLFDNKIKNIEINLNKIKSSISSLEADIVKANEFKHSDIYQKYLNKFEIEQMDKNYLYKNNYKLDEIIENLKNSQNSLNSFENQMRDILYKSIMLNLFNLDSSFLNFKRVENENGIDILATTQYIKNNIYDKNDFLEENINKTLTLAAKANIEIIKNDYASILEVKKDLEKNIAKINKQTNDIDITAITEIKLGIDIVIENNIILSLYNDIYKEVIENGFQTEYQLNLFENNSKKLLELLKKLDKELINLKDRNEKISFLDAFNLTFRVIQNGQDSGKRTSLDDIGSNGTDKIVKIILYVAMLNLYKDNADTNIHIVFDEIGTLDVKNIKELMDFINKKGFMFFNAIPNKLAEEYFQNIYLLKKNDNYTKVIKILEEEVEF